jgi:methylisocitrate lyase
MTWLTERDRNRHPAGDRLAALWAQPGIVRLPGAHDPLAALLARRAGFEALYLSGAAVTASLALPDLGILTLDELTFFTRSICRAVDLPLVVDGDTGYGEALNVMRLVRELEDAGAAAVQLEDHVLPKKCGHLSDNACQRRGMARKVAAAARAARHVDHRAHGRGRFEGLEAVIARARLYVEAGAHAVFPRRSRARKPYRRSRPQCVSRLANMTESERLAAARGRNRAAGYKMVICRSPSLAARAMEERYAVLAATGTQTALLERCNRAELYDVIGYDEYEALDTTIAKSVVPDRAEPVR